MISIETELYGLILSGGQSSRMGQDKAALEYYGKPQIEYLYELLKGFLPHTFISLRAGQEISFTQDVVIDSLDTKGPINGIISAMDAYPEASWLVLACDLPMITEKTIAQLIKERDSTKNATAFATQETGLPEPLVAIWENHGLEGLKDHHLNQGKNCPRKFLINSDIKLIHPENDLELYNANNPEEYQKAIALIK